MKKFTFNANPNSPDLWRILKISNHDGSDRTDGRYPLRIGCTVVILSVGINDILLWSYLSDSAGNEKSGYRRSGRINEVFYDAEKEILYAESKHSRYYLKRLPEKWEEVYSSREIAIPDSFSGESGAFPITVPARDIPQLSDEN